MADFDNGLPPEGTVIKESGVSAVTLDTIEYKEKDASSISSVVLAKAKAVDAPDYAVSAVVLAKEQAETHNRCMFL